MRGRLGGAKNHVEQRTIGCVSSKTARQQSRFNNTRGRTAQANLASLEAFKVPLRNKMRLIILRTNIKKSGCKHGLQLQQLPKYYCPHLVKSLPIKVQTACHPAKALILLNISHVADASTFREKATSSAIVKWLRTRPCGGTKYMEFHTNVTLTSLSICLLQQNNVLAILEQAQRKKARD